MKYVKKPLPVEAKKIDLDKKAFTFMDKNYPIVSSRLGKYLEIKTIDGIMRARHGDYIVKGVFGEVYPVKSSIFENTYVRYKK